MNKKSIEKFLPQKPVEVPVNFQQPAELSKRLKKKLKENGVSIKDFYNAAAMAYLSED